MHFTINSTNSISKEENGISFYSDNKRAEAWCLSFILRIGLGTVWFPNTCRIRYLIHVPKYQPLLFSWQPFSSEIQVTRCLTNIHLSSLFLSVTTCQPGNESRCHSNFFTVVTESQSVTKFKWVLLYWLYLLFYILCVINHPKKLYHPIYNIESYVL